MPHHPPDTVQHGGERETGKRKRRSTGGTFDTPHKTTGNAALCDIEQPNMTKERFRTLPTDEKLVTLFDLMVNVGTLDSRVTSVEHHVSHLLQDRNDTNIRLKVLEYKSIDAEARSRRDNLIFRGIPEVLVIENCEDIIKSFLRDELHIEPSVCVQRAHRIGRPGARAPGLTYTHQI